MNVAFTIIVPIYNEEDNMLRLEQELSDYLMIATVKTSVLFVNDGSKDDSQHFIEEICNRRPEFNFISFEKNCGLSAAIKAGFDHATSPRPGYIDPDLQTAPEDFNLSLNEIEHFDLVPGARATRHDSFGKNTPSTIN